MHMNKNKKRVNNRKWNYSMPLIQTDELTATETNTHRIREKQKVKYLLYLHSTIMSWEHYTMYKKSRVVSKYHLTEGTKLSCRGQWEATNALTSVVCRWNLWPDLVERRTKTKGGGAGERSPGPCSRGQGHLKGEVHEFKIYSNFLEKQDILVREREDQKAKYLCFVCTAPLCNEAVPKRAVLFFWIPFDWRNKTIKCLTTDITIKKI